MFARLPNAIVLIQFSSKHRLICSKKIWKRLGDKYDRHLLCTLETHSQSAPTCVVGWIKLRHLASLRLACMCQRLYYQRSNTLASTLPIHVIISTRTVTSVFFMCRTVGKYIILHCGEFSTAGYSDVLRYKLLSRRCNMVLMSVLLSVTM